MKPLVEVQNIAFEYEKDKPVFDGISLSVEPGQVLCVVGPNGCGKTTLLDCVLGLNKYTRGQVLLSGEDAKPMKRQRFAELVAYVPQAHRSTFPYTVLDVVVMGRTYAARMFDSPSEEDRQNAREALAMVGLQGFEDRSYTQLSGGELQLVLLARAISQRSALIIMDEPTAHLDFMHELNIMEVITLLVKERRLSVLMATHFLNQPLYLENAGIDTRVALMNQGRFYRVGLPSEVLNEKNLEDVFGIVAKVAESDIEGYKRKYIISLHRKGH